MKKCGEGKKNSLNKFIRGLLAGLGNLGKKYLMLADPTYEIQAQREMIKALREQIIQQTEQLRIKNSYLEKQNKDLEELNREKDAIISIVAHDLRAPLNRSKSLSKILQSTQLSEEQKEITTMILQVSDQGLHLIDEVLHINSIDYERLEPVTINLSQFINHYIRISFQEPAHRKNIRIHTAIEDHLEIVTDESSLRRIIDNLVSNALKFSPPNTSIFIKILSVDNAVYISIQDQGPGISVEDQKKLFRKFQKLSARPTSGETSTGLGLAIVKSLVKKLNGEISVHSELGQGTEFSIRLNKEEIINWHEDEEQKVIQHGTV